MREVLSGTLSPLSTHDRQELTNWENILITKYKDRVINFEIPPEDHLTNKFILNPVEGSRSAPTRISNQNHSKKWQRNDDLKEI